ncbi:MAG: NADH-quinone oxidoreductase subunit B family protein [Elusimicrobia bacterium]|nr:NADH-quinone oxidoreductase subunit B family protein [Elusimicrobiota bacterium]
MRKIIENSIRKGILTRTINFAEIENTGSELKKEIDKIFGRSFHIREVDTGSCGACDSEIMATTNPIYDIQRFGIDFVASPRHADALLVTGALSENMKYALKAAYDAMPDPKYVITVGDCALDGGEFKNSYYVLEKIESVIPVTINIPGCPPKPIDIMKAILSLMKGKL